MKRFSLALLITLLLCGLSLADTFQVYAQAPGVIVIISSDTTWTKAESPHDLTGPLLVNEGVTLTIEAGATVNLSYDILVNGTLVAKGTSYDLIHFKGGRIEFTKYSNGWNEQTGSGCLIENAVLENVELSSSVALKMNNTSIQETYLESELLLISNSNITGKLFVGGTSVISSNVINGTIVADSTKILNNSFFGSSPIYDWLGRLIGVDSPISVSGSSLISNNTVTAQGGVGINVISGPATVSGNVISNASTGIMLTDDATIGGNLLIDNHFGIVIQKGNLIILNNKITDGDTGIVVHAGSSATIEGNLISNHFGYGINIESQAIIRNNTLINNSSYAIRLYNSPLSSINYNNIEGYRYRSIWMEGPPSYDIDATNNWWGTTDTQTINLSIWDYKYDFNLGKVTFFPFLNEPNPEAEPNPETLPAQNPVIPEFPSWIILSLLVVATLVLSIARNKLEKKRLE